MTARFLGGSSQVASAHQSTEAGSLGVFRDQDNSDNEPMLRWQERSKAFLRSSHQASYLLLTSQEEEDEDHGGVESASTTLPPATPNEELSSCRSLLTASLSSDPQRTGFEKDAPAIASASRIGREHNPSCDVDSPSARSHHQTVNNDFKAPQKAGMAGRSNTTNTVRAAYPNRNPVSRGEQDDCTAKDLLFCPAIFIRELPAPVMTNLNQVLGAINRGLETSGYFFEEVMLESVQQKLIHLKAFLANFQVWGPRNVPALPKKAVPPSWRLSREAAELKNSIAPEEIRKKCCIAAKRAAIMFKTKADQLRDAIRCLSIQNQDGKKSARTLIGGHNHLLCCCILQQVATLQYFLDTLAGFLEAADEPPASSSTYKENYQPTAPRLLSMEENHTPFGNRAGEGVEDQGVFCGTHARHASHLTTNSASTNNGNATGSTSSPSVLTASDGTSPLPNGWESRNRSSRVYHNRTSDRSVTKYAVFNSHRIFCSYVSGFHLSVDCGHNGGLTSFDINQLEIHFRLANWTPAWNDV